jgi:hypothetical protein
MPQPAGALDADGPAPSQGSGQALSEVEGLLPNRHLALWPYTRWRDDRLHLDDDLILVQGRAQLPPLKIGCFNRHGWIAYLRAGVLFVKRLRRPANLRSIATSRYATSRHRTGNARAAAKIGAGPVGDASGVEARAGIDASPAPDGHAPQQAYWSNGP